MVYCNRQYTGSFYCWYVIFHISMSSENSSFQVTVRITFSSTLIFGGVRVAHQVSCVVFFCFMINVHTN